MVRAKRSNAGRPVSNQTHGTPSQRPRYQPGVTSFFGYANSSGQNLRDRNTTNSYHQKSRNRIQTVSGIQNVNDRSGRNRIHPHRAFEFRYR